MFITLIFFRCSMKRFCEFSLFISISIYCVISTCSNSLLLHVNIGSWSDILVIIIPEICLSSITFARILSIKVLEVSVMRVGNVILAKNVNIAKCTPRGNVLNSIS